MFYLHFVSEQNRQKWSRNMNFGDFIIIIFGFFQLLIEIDTWSRMPTIEIPDHHLFSPTLYLSSLKHTYEWMGERGKIWSNKIVEIKSKFTNLYRISKIDTLFRNNAMINKWNIIWKMQFFGNFCKNNLLQLSPERKILVGVRVVRHNAVDPLFWVRLNRRRGRGPRLFFRQGLIHHSGDGVITNKFVWHDIK